MAGEWIKMRVDLPTHPKVVRISSALQADRLRVVGGLLCVWGLFDAHSTDGNLEGYTPQILNDTIGFPGFAEAMIAVGWLSFDGEFLSVARFEEHNGQSAKKRAQDADRKRNVRQLSEENPDSVLKMSASEADKKRTREDKNKKEKNPPTPQEGDWVRPDWIPEKSWKSFEEMRRKRKKPLTDRAREMAVAKLQALQAGGNDPGAVIDQTVLHAWDTFYPLKTDDSNGPQLAPAEAWETSL